MMRTLTAALTIVLLALLLCVAPAPAADPVTDTGTELLANVVPAQAAPVEKSPVEVILAPLQADCVGAGGKWDGTAEFLLYCTWHF